MEELALLAQIISFPVAAYALYAGRVDAKKGRDLELMMEMSESMRTRWESGWADVVHDVEKSGPSEAKLKEHARTFRYMLNWIDWVGTILKTETIGDDEVLFGSLGLLFKRILTLCRPIIEEDVRKHGREWWGQLLPVAYKLRMKWLIALLREPAPAPAGTAAESS